MNTLVCKLSSLEEDRARGFKVSLAGRDMDIILISHAGDVFAYQNRCPHTGVNLDWMPGEFMDISGKLLQCATHGALFKPDDGFCIHGPCSGEMLKRVPVMVKDGLIYLQN